MAANNVFGGGGRVCLSCQEGERKRKRKRKGSGVRSANSESVAWHKICPKVD